MYPDRDTALQELEIAGQMNPGPWTAHSRNVAKAAEAIAAKAGMDIEKAFVCGLLHDIGRRTGWSAVRHIVDGYDYMMSRGWDEVARICMTHSFPVQDFEKDIGKKDVTPEQYAFAAKYLQEIEYDDYDRLIILCDSLGDAESFCILEKRLVNTTRRYGVFPFTLERWNNTFAMKEYFDERVGGNVYALLPGIEKCIFG